MTALIPETVEYPLCSSCAAAICNADLSAHTGFGLDLLICFMAAAGNLVHTRTAPVPDTDEWQCTGCHELCIDQAEWFTNH